MVSRTLAYTLMISAIYWVSPAHRFNIVSAVDTRGGYIAPVKVDKGSIEKSAQVAATAKGQSVETYLRASLEFLEGVDRLATSDVNLSDSVVREHFKVLNKESLDLLKEAKAQLEEFRSILTRAPAAEGSDQFMKTKVSLERALEVEKRFDQKLSNVSFVQNREDFRKELTRVENQVKDALGEQKRLSSKYGV